MRIAICDDEPKDAELILRHCHTCQLQYDIKVFLTASELLNAFSTEFYDLVFLDIEMAHPNGYEAGAELVQQEPKPLIIFTTNYLQYAVQGYGIAFRYLCKPVTLSMFQKAFHDAVSYILPKKILLSGSGIQKNAVVNDILYFESLGHHIIFHFKNNEEFEVNASMKQMADKFSYPNFLQVHQSFCINLNYVDSIKPLQVILTDKTVIPVSRKKQEIFQERFMKLVRGN